MYKLGAGHYADREPNLNKPPLRWRAQGKQFDGQTQWKPLRTTVFRAEVQGIPIFLFRASNNFFKGRAAPQRHRCP